MDVSGQPRVPRLGGDGVWYGEGLDPDDGSNRSVGLGRASGQPSAIQGTDEAGRPREAAVDRGASARCIHLPEEAVDRIGELLVQGSSLVVSDEGLGRETGRGTEFIVLTR